MTYLKTNLALAVLIGTIAAGVRADTPPLPPVQPQVVTHVARTERVVALTFDACQTRKMAGFDKKIFAILKQTHTPATLFLGGRWMETHPQETRELAADTLLELGNHSYLHPHMTKISTASVREELLKTQEAMYKLTGKQGTLFRPPYGEYDKRLVDEAASLGLTTVTWEVVTGDPDKHVQARDIVQTALHKTKPGSIIIMHINGRGWHTAEALPAVIEGLKKRGYRFVTLSECLAR